jgi:tartrate-resistant acid phosphatase type 5
MIYKLLFLKILFLTNIVYAYSEICIVGDTGIGEKSQYQVAEAMYKSKCKTILHTGDVIYENGVKSEQDGQWKTKFEDPFAVLINSGSDFYMSMGNHDYSGVNSEKLRKIHKAYSAKNSFYIFPDLFYDFKIDDTCVWAIDSNRFTDEQTSYLKKSLSATASSCAWKIFFGHHPIVSSGKHGNAKPKSDLKQKLDPLLIQYADIYFAGHDHNLADEGSFPNKSGYRQIVSGAGAKLRPVKSCSQTGCEYSESKLGFVKAYFKKDSVVMDFIDIDLNILHTTTLNK